MKREFRDAFMIRFRWPLIVLGVIGGVLLTVVLYNVTAPRPSAIGGGDAKAVPEGATIRVGALPVT